MTHAMEGRVRGVKGAEHTSNVSYTTRTPFRLHTSTTTITAAYAAYNAARMYPATRAQTPPHTHSQHSVMSPYSLIPTSYSTPFHPSIDFPSSHPLHPLPPSLPHLVSCMTYAVQKMPTMLPNST